MNLDLLPLGWVHFIASLAALGLGIFVLLRPKGTVVHKLRGRAYAIALLVTSVTALGIYRRGVFFFPHWFAVASLVVLAVGVGAGHFKVPRTRWQHVHLTAMLTSVYILIGGGINEVYLRVNVLRRLVPDLNSPIVGLTHMSVMVLFAALIVYFNVAVGRRSRTMTRAQPGD